jgi:hypothetical protein
VISLLPDVLYRPGFSRAFDPRRSRTARSLARAFTPPPPEPLWHWADEHVTLVSEDAAEPGPYRSSKTPWTRRIQEVMIDRIMLVWNAVLGRWEPEQVIEIAVKKSSQSGYSETCLNRVRWAACYRPCNVIYAIDSAVEARKIAERLLRSLAFLDRSIFTGDADDLKALSLRLRGMSVLFYGSYTSGAFANKQAPLLFSDEVEEQGEVKGDTSSTRNLDSRKKSSTGGLHVLLSKPKLKDGPIDKAHARGNQEECYVPCPHCGHRQPLTFFPEEYDSPFSADLIEVRDEQTGAILGTMPVPLPAGEVRRVRTGQLRFDHCKDALGRWDQLRILRETYYECAHCTGAIHQSQHQRWMLDRLQWLPTNLGGTPGIISQHINDLYLEDELCAWGRIALDYLNAKEESYTALQGFYNHRLGKAWSEEANTTEQRDILDNIGGRTLFLVDAPNSKGQPIRHVFHDEGSAAKLVATATQSGFPAVIIASACPAYSRGQVPFVPATYQGVPLVIGGSDLGGNYAKWSVGAVDIHGNIAFFDWGSELGPQEVLALMRTKRWPGPKDAEGKERHYGMSMCFMDCRWRTEEVYKTAHGARGGLIPCMGQGGMMATTCKLFNFVEVPTFRGVKRLDFNKQRANDAYYRDRIKFRRKRVWFPTDVQDHEADTEYIAENCAEFQEEDRKGNLVWSEEPSGPNHFGDCNENIVVGVNFLMRTQPTK